MLSKLRRILQLDAPQIPSPTETAALPSVILKGGATVQVVSESHYQDALKKLAGGHRRRDEQHDFHVVAELRLEPTNPHDKNAIQVRVKGNVVGYLSRDDARAYQKVVSQLANQRKPATCHAKINGGWYTSRNDQGHFGIVLSLAPPDACL